MPAALPDAPLVQSLVPLLDVHDIEASLKFYTEGLGFEVVHTWSFEDRLRWARLQNGRAELMLNVSDVTAAAPAAAAERRRRAPFSDSVLYLTVADPDAVHARLAALGHAVGDPFDSDYAMREFHARDLDGYELAIVAPLMRI